MCISRLWVLGAILISACIGNPKPNLGIEDCLARNDCIAVTVDNSSNPHWADFRINGTKYGTLAPYSKASYSLYTDRLIHFNCAVVSATYRDNGEYLQSSEECFEPGSFFRVEISDMPKVIWLTPVRNRR